MSLSIIAFFNNKGGVDKTTLVYHLAWMFSDFGCRVLAVDLDPQANLTAAFLNDEILEELWPDGPHPDTIQGCIEPLQRGIGDIGHPHIEHADCFEESPSLLVGDLALSRFEDELSQVWPHCMDGKERAFRVTSAFWRMIQGAARDQCANIALVDLGPNLGAINRAALIASDYIVVPLAPDLFSLQGLRNLGPTLRDWRAEWQGRLKRNPERSLQLPTGRIQPAGYIVMQHSERLDRPVKSYNRWMTRIPDLYRLMMLGEHAPAKETVNSDPHCLALLKHYRSLVPLAQEARKPIFHLKPADGAIGSHFYNAQEAGRQFQDLARNIAQRTGLGQVLGDAEASMGAS